MSQSQTPEEAQAQATENQPPVAVEESAAPENASEKASPPKRKNQRTKAVPIETVAESRSGDRDEVRDGTSAEEAPGNPGSDGEKSAEGGGGRESGRRGQRSPRQRSRRKGGGHREDGNPSSRSGENASTPEDAPSDSDETSESNEGEGGDDAPRKTRKQRYLERKEKERAREAAALEASPAVESEGIVEISSKGFGFLREKKRGFQQSPKDVFITPEVVRNFAMRDGLMVKCISKQGVRGPQLIELLQINGRDPQDYVNLPYFEELTAINPDKKLTLETDSARKTTRVIDLIAPIGRGQRGLIVAPPRTGKTTLLHHIAEGILKNYEGEMHLMVLLVDERPEEVTDFERSFPDIEVFSSSNDSEAQDHTRMALLAIERAKRLVEAGEHVFILMDSITRLARAFNSQMRGGGKRGTASGGLLVGALEVPRRIFAAARNTREAGSLTIIATALIQTNSKADEAIFQEFKGTGNMELVLDRQIAQNYVYPAVDINKSGTRREELLLPPHMLEKIYVIRRGLSGYKQLDAMEWLLRCMERYPSNAQMLMDIKTTALS